MTISEIDRGDRPDIVSVPRDSNRRIPSATSRRLAMTGRRLVAASALPTALATVLLCSACAGERKSEGASQTQRELVVVSYGGSYQEAQAKAFVQPFAERYDVNVREEIWNGDFASLRAMVESGDVTWDVVGVDDYMVLRGAAEGLLEKIDYSRVSTDELIPEAVHDYGVASAYYSTVLAYNTDRYSGADAHPVGWSQFWDVQRFPGPRTLRNNPVATLELALLASGVPKDELYPLDVDRAFSSLDQIKADVTVWWEAGAQPAQLLAAGDVWLGSAWNGRIYSAAQAGQPVALDWEGGIMSSDWWVIPRGAKNSDVAQDFIAFASSAVPQAALPTLIPYGPVNQIAIQKLTPGVLQNLPTAPENLAKQVVIDAQWWNENLAQVLERWNAWLPD
jgi:putative spermidine/putrescine transport system substrate-binding protein